MLPGSEERTASWWSPDDPRRSEWIRRAFALISQYIRDEEDELLPRMRDALGDRRLRHIGAAWEAVRAGAPTHPHPAIPRRPPGNALSGPPLSVFDRLRQPQRTLRQFRGRSCERGSVGPRATGYSAPQTQPG